MGGGIGLMNVLQLVNLVFIRCMFSLIFYFIFYIVVVFVFEVCYVKVQSVSSVIFYQLTRVPAEALEYRAQERLQGFPTISESQFGSKWIERFPLSELEWWK